MRRLDEKGITLVEILGGIVLLSVVFALGSLVLSQAASLVENTSIRTRDDNRMKQAVKVIRAELSQASAVFVVNSQEIRYRQNFDYYALHRDGQILSLYRFNNMAASSDDLTEEQIEVAQADFMNPAITIGTNAPYYTEARVLSDQIAELTFLRPVEPGAYQAVNGSALIESGNFKIDVRFHYRRSRAGSAVIDTDSNMERNTFEIVAKLLRDNL